ncbi:MAG: 4Fe-4S binding protein [Candidatus Hodarchaeales archaeon]
MFLLWGDSCADCCVCVQRCYFHARKTSEEGKLLFNPSKCVGCGLCV